MATRNLLHRKKLSAFKEWLEDSYGWCLLYPVGAFEVLRWENDADFGGAMPIIFNGKSPVHYSCNDAATPYVRKFIKECK